MHVDSQTVYHLILAHEHFFSSVRLFRTLAAALKKAGKNDVPAEALRAQLRYVLLKKFLVLSSGLLFTAFSRIINVLKMWFMTDFSGVETDDDLVKEVEEFIANVRQENPAFNDYITMMIKARERKEKIAESIQSGKSGNKNTIPEKDFNDYTLLDFEPLEIARQLCLIEERMLVYTLHHNCQTCCIRSVCDPLCLVIFN